ncbi:hypothetical protein HCH_03328 [Hahella chejuensis KCTC 2396]|uniref:Uncharacterized protein n=1 Tax=Hahella chejuensis (strain KCTC 2396) TaxID=349521 RepID=Q2SGZ1_HAHCH|nr:hypothetical protein [Hahella chejuensis]ABC30083.1 hypothetical protein HCH_03328 [Hahella chejuensis KCTC 2396]
MYEINQVLGVCENLKGEIYEVFTHYDEGDAVSAVGTITKSPTDKNGIVLGQRPPQVLWADTQLNAMWMSPEGNLWVVDRSGNAYTDADVTFPTPPQPSFRYKKLAADKDWNVTYVANNLLQAVWGTSNNDVWASSFRGQAYHWDGQCWSEHDIGNVSTAMDGSGPDDIYIVGYHGKIHHYDGQTWKQIPYPDHLPEGEVFTDVKVISESEVYICGRSGDLLKGNAKDGFVDIGSPEYTWYGIGCLNERIFLAGGSKGIFELKDGQFICLKDKGNPVGVFETQKAIYFIPGEQQENSWIIQYWPGADKEWMKISS